MLRRLAPVLLSVVVVAACGGGERSPSADSAVVPATASRDTARRSIDVHLAGRDGRVGAAWALLAGGDSIRLADSVLHAWRLDDGATVALSGLDGAGGYENEGQSLRLVDVATGRVERVLSELFPIEDVELVRDGPARVLLVLMRDGGAGSLHVTVVDPARGPVYRALRARAYAEAGRIVVERFEGTPEAVTHDTPGPATRIDTLTVAALVDPSRSPTLAIPSSRPR